MSATTVPTLVEHKSAFTYSMVTSATASVATVSSSQVPSSSVTIASPPPSSPLSTTSTTTSPKQVLQIQRLKLKQQRVSYVIDPNEPVRNPMLMVAMLFGGLVLTLLLMAFFAYAPGFCAAWLALMYIVGMYLSTESKWWWHDAQEFENRFWTTTAFLFSTAILYIEDSPISIGRWHAGLGMFLVVSFTSGVHILDRIVHRKAISRVPHLTKDASLTRNLFKYKATAEEKTNLVTDCVRQIDRMLLPSTINNMINLAQVKRVEQKIFRILAGASKDELNYMINNIRLALLFYKVKDHSRVRGEDQCRTLIVDLLCTGRLADLSITSRAILLDALMVMKLSAHPMSEKWVRNIILKTSGDDLSNLKTYSDAKGDVHSIHKLVFSDIRDPMIRNDILNHIRREAGVQTAHMRLGTKKAIQRRQHAWRKVLSDVDDTLFSSGGRYPAGIDSRYPRHVLYPGVLSFYRELDLGSTGPDEWSDDRVGNLVFLSARPHVYKDVSEKKSYSKFAALYQEKRMHTLPTLLAGCLQSGRAFMIQGDLEPMARKKYENFCEYYQLYPEFTHVFVGDNGQGDVRAAELIVEKFGSSALEAAFFHMVQPIEKTFGYKSKETLSKWQKMNIVFFKTYAGAAIEAFKMGKIRLSGLQKICMEACGQFEAITEWTSPLNREKARILLNEDLIRANAILTTANVSMPLIPLLTRPQRYPLHSAVRTPFGKGMIRKYRGVDGIYTIELTSWHPFSQIQSVVRTRQSPLRRTMAYFPEESIVLFVKGENTKITTSSVQYVSMYPPMRGRRYSPQTLVTTPFGYGRVLKFRVEDEIYVVRLDMGSASYPIMGYFVPEAVMERETDRLKASPRMFEGVRSSLGYITKRLSTFVPSQSAVSGTVSKPLFAVGATVETPFGRALVLGMRPDRVYHVQLVRKEVMTTTLMVQETAMEHTILSPSRSFFSMLGLSSRHGSSSRSGTLGTGSTSSSLSSTPLASLPQGAAVDTPYGKGLVQYYRPNDSMYEVILTDWTLAGQQPVCAYLTKSYVRLSSKDEVPLLELPVIDQSVDQPVRSGLFQLFRYGFNSGSDTDPATVNPPPYSNQGVSRRVHTPFGVGFTTMSKSYHGVLKVELESTSLCGTGVVVAYVQDSAIMELPHPVRRNTLELLGLPFSYLRNGWPSTTASENGSAFEGVVVKPQQKFATTSLVMTPFGEGCVTSYRIKDQVYKVSVGTDQPIDGYFQPSALAHAVRGVVSEPVATSFGSGILMAVRPQDGVHVVTLRHALIHDNSINIYGYFQPTAVQGAIKAARGDVVKTPYGSGVVMQYRAIDKCYCVALEWDLKGKSHVMAYLRVEDVMRTGVDEKAGKTCVVM